MVKPTLRKPFDLLRFATDPTQWHRTRELIESGLPYSDVDLLAAGSGFSAAEIGRFLQVPPSTFARRRDRGRLTAPESERLLRLARLFQLTLDLHEHDRDAARLWLTTPARSLDRETPLDRARSELGARQVEDLIGRLEHGVFS
jgi:putative toxin-antitoxin system antitoxin component (TIGR02293 family)